MILRRGRKSIWCDVTSPPPDQLLWDQETFLERERGGASIGWTNDAASKEIVVGGGGEKAKSVREQKKETISHSNTNFRQMLSYICKQIYAPIASLQSRFLLSCVLLLEQEWIPKNKETSLYSSSSKDESHTSGDSIFFRIPRRGHEKNTHTHTHNRWNSPRGVI